MSKFIEILLRIIESPRCLWLFIAACVPTSIFYFCHRNGEQALYILLFLASYIALAGIVWIISSLSNSIDCYKEKRYLRQKDDERNRQIKGYAEDCYNMLSEYEKHILMYIVLFGQKGNEWANKILLINCPRAQMIHLLKDKLNKYRYPELLIMDNFQCMSMNFDVFINKFLLDAIESDIKNRKLSKESVEQFLVDMDERAQRRFE